jgi:hypothetical protein
MEYDCDCDWECCLSVGWNPRITTLVRVEVVCWLHLPSWRWSLCSHWSLVKVVWWWGVFVLRSRCGVTGVMANPYFVASSFFSIARDLYLIFLVGHVCCLNNLVPCPWTLMYSRNFFSKTGRKRILRERERKRMLSRLSYHRLTKELKHSSSALSKWRWPSSYYPISKLKAYIISWKLNYVKFDKVFTKNR